MEDTLRVLLLEADMYISLVLILVLMEDTLRAFSTRLVMNKRYIVLILVLMEDTLRGPEE